MINFKPKLLLHFCCGPCGPEIFDRLSAEYDISAFWYNPNIYPKKEFDSRLKAFEDFCRSVSCQVVYGNGMDTEGFNEACGGFIANGGVRCVYCYEERLRRLAQKAAELDIKYFTTTLLSSFYQKIDIIKEICLRLEREYGLNFVFGEFWKSYYASNDRAREMGLYIQKYCGCKWSLNERKEKKTRKI